MGIETVTFSGKKKPPLPSRVRGPKLRESDLSSEPRTRAE
jgi:hypothetical protein